MPISESRNGYATCRGIFHGEALDHRARPPPPYEERHCRRVRQTIISTLWCANDGGQLLQRAKRQGWEMERVAVPDPPCYRSCERNLHHRETCSNARTGETNMRELRLRNVNFRLDDGSTGGLRARRSTGFS